MNSFSRFRKLIPSIENPDTPFLHYILGFFSWVTLRNFLEIFSDKARVFFRLLPETNILYFAAWQGLMISFLHYYFFWTGTALLIGILVYLCTKENLGKIFRIVLFFSFILNITPLFDLLISRGSGFDISYMYPKNITQFLPLPQGATPGVKVTFITALALVFLYCLVKTRRFLRSALTAFSLYAVLMVFALLPLLLKSRSPIPLIRFFSLLITAETLIICYIQNRAYFFAILKDIRLTRILHFQLMFLLGIFLAKPLFKELFRQNILSFILSLLAIAGAWIAAVMLNNLADLEIDRVSNPGRPLVTGAIPQNAYKKICLLIFLLALLSAAAINFSTLFFTLLIIGNSVIYSLRPFRLKRIPLFSKMFISFNSLSLVMLGYMFAGKELLDFPPMVIWYFLIFITLCLNFIDLKDYEGDKATGILTLPVILGMKKAKLLTGIFFLITYPIMALVFADLRLFAPGLLLGALQFFLINTGNYREKPVLLTHLAGLLLLLIYLTI